MRLSDVPSGPRPRAYTIPAPYSTPAAGAPKPARKAKAAPKASPAKRASQEASRARGETARISKPPAQRKPVDRAALDAKLASLGLGPPARTHLGGGGAKGVKVPGTGGFQNGLHPRDSKGKFRDK